MVKEAKQIAKHYAEAARMENDRAAGVAGWLSLLAGLGSSQIAFLPLQNQSNPLIATCQPGCRVTFLLAVLWPCLLLTKPGKSFQAVLRLCR